MKTTRFAVVLPIVIGSLVSAGLPASADPASGSEPLNSTAVPSRYTQQTLDWHLCADAELPSPRPEGTGELECATFRTPRDWDHPGQGADLTIAASRLRSTGETTASLFTNPGGPGVPGRPLPAVLRNQSRVRAHQEIIGMDTRGTGRSTSISCGTTAAGADLDARDPAVRGRIADAVRDYEQACQRNSGELGSLVDTFQNVKDLDLLRILLDRPKINWVGYSAGTWLGAHYAQLFPDRTGRFVLDSTTVFTASWQQSFSLQPYGFERRWRQDFLPWMASYDGKYHFGTTGEAARKSYEDLRSALGRKPVDLGGTSVGPAVLDDLVVSNLKHKAAFPALAEILSLILSSSQGAAPADRHGAAGVAAAADDENDVISSATLFAVLCNDGPWTGDRQSVIDRTGYLAEHGAPLFAGTWMRFQMCAFHQGPTRSLPVMNGQGVPPVLIVQSEHDPATPIEGARRAHAQFRNSRMITVTDEGDHDIYVRSGNPAVDRLVEDFLVDGTVPADQSVRGVGLPRP